MIFLLICVIFPLLTLFWKSHNLLEMRVDLVRLQERSRCSVAKFQPEKLFFKEETDGNDNFMSPFVQKPQFTYRCVLRLMQHACFRKTFNPISRSISRRAITSNGHAKWASSTLTSPAKKKNEGEKWEN